MIPLKLRFSPIYSLTFSSRKSVNCKPGRKVVKQIVNIRKIINFIIYYLLHLHFFQNACHQNCKTTVANHRSKNAPLRHESPENFNCLTHVNLPYEFFFQKSFQPAIVYSIRSQSVKFIRNASYINRKGLSCLLK